MSAPARTQELHSRIGDGILVRLLWRADDDHLFVTVTDSRENAEFCVEVRDRARALDVFHHPFAYAAHYGVQASPKSPRVSATAAVPA
jgi:hypothetical protein